MHMIYAEGVIELSHQISLFSPHKPDAGILESTLPTPVRRIYWNIMFVAFRKT